MASTHFSQKDIDEFRHDVLNPSYKEEFNFFGGGHSYFHYRTQVEAETAAYWFSYGGIANSCTQNYKGKGWMLTVKEQDAFYDMAQHWPISEVITPFLTQYLQHMKPHMRIHDGILDVDCRHERDNGGKFTNVLNRASLAGVLPNNSYHYNRGSVMIGNADLLGALKRMGVDMITDKMCMPHVSASTMWNATESIGKARGGPDLPKNAVYKPSITEMLAIIDKAKEKARGG